MRGIEWVARCADGEERQESRECPARAFGTECNERQTTDDE